MEEIIKFLGGATIFISAVAWLIKSLASHLLGKDIEKYKAQIKYEAEHGNQLLTEKIELYKEVFEPVIQLVFKIEDQGTLTKEDLNKFEKERLRTTALIAMFAPVEVFNNFNNMIDYIYDSFEGKNEWSFDKFRNLALVSLSEIRGDIGLFDDIVTYNGTR